MFSGKEEALNHRDAVVDVLEAQFGEEAAWHTHPVLDGCTVRIQQEDTDPATEAFEEAGFSVKNLGETGDWMELKVKP